jgi:hypothetical protein
LAFSYWTIKPWFFTERKFTAILIIPSSWGSQLNGEITSTPCRITLHDFIVFGCVHIIVYFANTLGCTLRVSGVHQVSAVLHAARYSSFDVYQVANYSGVLHAARYFNFDVYQIANYWFYFNLGSHVFALLH